MRAPAIRFLLPLLVLPFFAACGGGGGGGGGPAPAQPLPPEIEPSRIELHQRAPGSADGISGLPAALQHAKWALVMGADGAELGRSPIAADGSFAEVSIGDNAHAAVRVIGESEDGTRTDPVELANDVVAPQPAILLAPPLFDRNGTATFDFGCDEPSCTFRCGLSGVAPEPCSPPSSITPGDGVWTYLVEAIDAAGNVGTASWSWSIDTIAPSVEIREGPEADSAGTSARFAFECDEEGCSYQCSLDGAEFAACSTPHLVSDLVDGPHLFEVRAKDRAGNTGEAASWTWEVSSGPPTVINLTSPPAFANEAGISLAFGCSKQVCAFECRLAPEPFANCTSPHALANLSEGTHTFEVRATDGEGTTGETVTRTWTVDTIDPTIVVSRVSRSGIGGATAEIHFSADEPEVTFACELDGAGFTPCTPPVSYADLPSGDHVIAVRGTDRAGNESAPATATWTVGGPGSGWTRIAAGEKHTCGIDVSGALYCWGSNGSGQLGDGTTTPRASPVRIGTANDWAEVTSGAGHTCALESSGALFCWGDNDAGQVVGGALSPQKAPVQIEPDITWSHVAAGGAHTCAIATSGQLYCWGANSYGQLGTGDTWYAYEPTVVGTNADWIGVSAGALHTCAVRAVGELYCWGSNGQGQLGLGHTSGRQSPDRVGTSTDWTGVATGASHTCALKGTGELYCWGENGRGQLGNGGTTAKTAPVRIGSETDWASVDAGVINTCATRATGQLFCWGGNPSGQLGNGETSFFGGADKPALVGTASDWARVSAGGDHTCAVTTSGELLCWGSNAEGQLAIGGFGGDKSDPQPLDGSVPAWAKIAAGSNHSCAIDAGGALYCWGDSYRGAVGDGTTTSRPSPVRVGTASDWNSITAGISHTCGIRNAGELYCWGDNSLGMVGDGDYSNRWSPVRIGTASDWVDVAAGLGHTCAVRGNGTLHCWGSHSNGQLGKGAPTGGVEWAPVQVGTATDWDSVTAGMSHTCAIKKNRALYCWGSNSDGQLGTGDTTPQASPIRIGTASDWSTVSASNAYTCGTRSGALYCWGDNTSGQLGDDSTSDRRSPVQIGTSTNWSHVSAGWSFACGLRTNGPISCWGRNNSGMLGDGTTQPRLVPTPVQSAITSWQGVAAGGGHTCAIASGGATMCWGENDYGQLGDGTALRVEPTPVVLAAP